MPENHSSNDDLRSLVMEIFTDTMNRVFELTPATARSLQESQRVRALDNLVGPNSDEEVAALQQAVDEAMPALMEKFDADLRAAEEEAHSHFLNGVKNLDAWRAFDNGGLTKELEIRTGRLVDEIAIKMFARPEDNTDVEDIRQTEASSTSSHIDMRAYADAMASERYVVRPLTLLDMSGNAAVDRQQSSTIPHQGDLQRERARSMARRIRAAWIQAHEDIERQTEAPEQEHENVEDES